MACSPQVLEAHAAEAKKNGKAPHPAAAAHVSGAAKKRGKGAHGHWKSAITKVVTSQTIKNAAPDALLRQQAEAARLFLLQVRSQPGSAPATATGTHAPKNP